MLLESDFTGEEKLHNSICILKKYSFVKTKNNALYVHKLVQEIVKKRLVDSNHYKEYLFKSPLTVI